MYCITIMTALPSVCVLGDNDENDTYSADQSQKMERICHYIIHAILIIVIAWLVMKYTPGTCLTLSNADVCLVGCILLLTRLSITNDIQHVKLRLNCLQMFPSRRSLGRLLAKSNTIRNCSRNQNSC